MSIVIPIDTAAFSASEELRELKEIEHFLEWANSETQCIIMFYEHLANSVKNLELRNTFRGQQGHTLKEPLPVGLSYPVIDPAELDGYLKCFNSNVLKGPSKQINLPPLRNDALRSLILELKSQKVQFDLLKSDVQHRLIGIQQLLEILEKRKLRNFLSQGEVWQLFAFREMERQLTNVFKQIVKNLEDIILVEHHSEEEFSEEGLSPMSASDMSEDEEEDMPRVKENEIVLENVRLYNAISRAIIGPHCFIEPITEVVSHATTSHQDINSALNKMNLWEGAYLEDLFSFPESSQAETNPTIRRAALGRQERLGAFYDATRDTFVPGNIFNKGCPNESRTKCLFMTRELKTVSNEMDVCMAVQMEPELLLSCLTSNLEMSGSAKYFIEERRSFSDWKHIVGTLRVKTGTETVNLGKEEVSECVEDPEIPVGATHVVVGVQKGCNMYTDICYSTTLGFTSSTKDTTFPGVRIKVFSDISSDGETKCLSRIEDLKAWIEDFADKAVNKYNQVNIAYVLLDINVAGRLLKLPQAQECKGIYRPLSLIPWYIEKYFEFQRNVREHYMPFGTFKEKMETLARLNPVKSQDWDLQRFEDAVQRTIGKTIQAIREGKEDEKEQVKLLEGNFNSQTRNNIIEHFFSYNKRLQLLCQMADKLQECNVAFPVSSQEVFDLRRAERAYILLYSYKHLGYEIKDVLLHFEIICRNESTAGETVFAAVDKDAFSATETEEFQGVRIARLIKHHVVKNGKEEDCTMLVIMDPIQVKVLSPTNGEAMLFGGSIQNAVNQRQSATSQSNWNKTE